MRITLPAAAVVLVLLSVAGCVSPPPEPPRPAPTPAPRPQPAPPPPAAADWRDWPVTPGDWSYTRDGRGSRAAFGPSGGAARLVLRCDLGERRLYLSREGTSLAPVAVRTSSMTRALPVRAEGGTSPRIAATLAAGDPLLDAMAFSRGRFAIEQAGAPTLVLPAWAEVGRVIEDCRG